MINFDAQINFCQPSLKGRRLTVYDIVTKIYYEDDIKIALDDYNISLVEAKDAIGYCMDLKCTLEKSLINYCDGCILRTFAEGWNFKDEDYIEFKNNNGSFVMSKDNKVLFAGTLEELKDSEFGKFTWLIAEEVMKRMSDNEIV